MALFYSATVTESRCEHPKSSVFPVFSFTNPFKPGLSLWLCSPWSGRVLHLSDSVIMGSLGYRCTCAQLHFKIISLLTTNQRAPENNKVVAQTIGGIKLICHHVMRGSHREDAAAEVWLAIAALHFCRLLDPDSF